MRKPEMTKNTSTPTNPPGRRAGQRWYSTTARTANARSPWMSHRVGSVDRGDEVRRDPRVGGSTVLADIAEILVSRAAPVGSGPCSSASRTPPRLRLGLGHRDPGGSSAAPSRVPRRRSLWLGAHAGSPSVVVNPAMVGGADTLRDWIADEPETALGPDRTGLPFLLKVLAAAAPLSLQAHPTPEQAEEGFAREEREGIPLDDPARNYKDPFPKPEPRRRAERALRGAERLPPRRGDPGRGARARRRHRTARSARGAPAARAEDTVRWLETADESALAVVQAASDLAVSLDDDLLTPNTATVRDLATSWPGDPGIVVSLLMHRVTLAAGQAMYLPAGNVHAYLDGLGIELMAPSDNVLRGGFTPKHVDVPELLRVLDFTAYPAPVLEPRAHRPGCRPVCAGRRRVRAAAGGRRRPPGGTEHRRRRPAGRPVDRRVHRGCRHAGRRAVRHPAPQGRVVLHHAGRGRRDGRGGLVGRHHVDLVHRHRRLGDGPAPPPGRHRRPLAWRA